MTTTFESGFVVGDRLDILSHSVRFQPGPRRISPTVLPVPPDLIGDELKPRNLPLLRIRLGPVFPYEAL